MNRQPEGKRGRLYRKGALMCKREADRGSFEFDLQ